MGTYTTNKELYMPTVGEQGWGTLVNGNFETIDTFLKPITVSGSTYTFTGNLVGNQSGGSISATSISNSGILTSTGKITANGGIGTTSLTTSSTITSTGQIVANGGIKGNLTGKILVSSVGTNSNNLKICTLSASNGSGSSNGNATISASQVGVSRYNTSILNCTKTDTELKAAASATCTLTMTFVGSTSGSATITVKDSYGTTVATKSDSSIGKGQSLIVTFTRQFNTTYTVTGFYATENWSTVIKTNSVTFYVS